MKTTQKYTRPPLEAMKAHPFSLILFLIICLFIISTLFSCATKNLMHEEYRPPYYSPLQKKNIRNMAKESLFIPYRKNFVNWKGQNLLSLAILSEEIDVIDSLLQSGVKPNIQDNEGNTPLMYAAKNIKQLSIVKKLILADADVNLQNNDGMTALMFAATHNTQPQIVQHFLDIQADISLENNKGETVWDILQENPHLNTTDISRVLAHSPEQLLIELIKEVDLKDVDKIQNSSEDMTLIYKKNTTTLMWAAKFNRKPSIAINSLLGAVSVEKKDIDGNNVVHYAINNIYSNQAKEMGYFALSKTNSPMDLANNSGENPFLTALKIDAPEKIAIDLMKNHQVLENPINLANAMNIAGEYTSHIAVHRDLIKRNVSLTKKDEFGKTPYHYLSAGKNNNNAKLFKLYLKNGASNDDRDNEDNIPLHIVAKTTKSTKIINIVSGKRLFNKNKSKIATLHGNIIGKNPLHIAAQHNNNLKIIRRLVKVSIPALLQNKDKVGRLPVSYAAEFNENPGIIRFLLNKSRLDTTNNNNTTILMFAARNTNNEQAVPIVLKKVKKDMISKVDKDGNTALHFAARFSKYTKAIQVLLKAGADVNAQNNLGQTPLMLAMLNEESPDIAVALLTEDTNFGITDNEGFPVITYVALYSKFIEHVRLLYSADVQTSYIDENGIYIEDLLLQNKYLAPYLQRNKELPEAVSKTTNNTNAVDPTSNGIISNN